MLQPVMTGGVKAHSPVEETKKAGMAGKKGVFGIRREDKNKWERRAPLAPHHVAALVKQGIKVLVQPSTRRAYTDEEYMRAGAEISEDLTECATIGAVKEVPVDVLLPGRTWLFFSHTIKAQPAGMPLLDVALQRNVRLLDYECITSTGKRGAPRLVAFGAYAGYAGAIDFARGLGERFLALGFSTPLLHVGSSFMYPSLEHAKKAIVSAGEAIKNNGLPRALCPLTVIFTGSGNVSKGALDIFKLLPHDMVAPEDLPALHSGSANISTNKVYLCVVNAEHMVKRKDGGKFDKKEYYVEPDKYESKFQDTILPYCTAIVNGMYWDARFPRLFTKEDLAAHVKSGRDKLLGVGDITCDENGSVPTKQFTSIEDPFFVYNALTDEVSHSQDGPGVLFHAVDHLPSELPKEATEHFGNCLLPFLPDLINGKQDLPPPMAGAIICEGGELKPEFEYIQQLRRLNEEKEEMAAEGAITSVKPHAFHAPPASVMIEITGHLFDSRLINKICDLAEGAKARVQILHLDVGTMGSVPSNLSLLLMAHSEDRLQKLLAQVTAAASEAKATLRRSGPENQAAAVANASDKGAARRSVLVLGAGFVSGPVVEYLLRRPENSVTIAGLEKEQVDRIAQVFGSRVQPEVIDITSSDAGTATRCEELVKNTDLIISLVPATLHVGMAKLAVKHKKHMVTASYVSPDMEKLDKEAKDAGVLILNEVGLDPGIDHMSAMKMIDSVKASGGEVIRFSSLCGGLPAPEAAGANPIGYKFSWSPKGVLSAARNAARFKENGKLTEIPGSDLLASAKPMTLNNALAFDVLPNRDSTAFAELYGLQAAPSFFRGTFRYAGFCDRMLALSRLGMLEPGPNAALKSATSLRSWLALLLGAKADAKEDALHTVIRKKLGESADVGISFMAWLGLFSEQPLPSSVPADSPLDIVSQLLQRPETAYKPNERDMVAMQHELVVKSKSSGTVQRHVATLLDYGEPMGDTAMSRTVGITAAICAQLVLDSPKGFGFGVQRPLEKKWYDPCLAKLELEGIKMQESVETVSAAAKL